MRVHELSLTIRALSNATMPYSKGVSVNGFDSLSFLSGTPPPPCVYLSFFEFWSDEYCGNSMHTQVDQQSPP